MTTKRDIEHTEKVITVAATVSLVLAVVAIAVATYRIGYNTGFQACIEENNLYYRYEK